jgi:hypothetical protein
LTVASPTVILAWRSRRVKSVMAECRPAQSSFWFVAVRDTFPAE